MKHCCLKSDIVESTGNFFSKRSKSYAKSFRKGKLEKLQQRLIDELSKEPLTGKSVLDIGSGVGKLHLSLVRLGASEATGIDMSEAMITNAKTFAAQFGVENKVSYHQGDFMDLSETLDSFDITVLDKVICCYEDMEGLITRSAGKTKSFYALIYPANNIAVKIIVSLQIAFTKLFRFGFRPFWHDWNSVTPLLMKNQFSLMYSSSTPVWQLALYRRNDSA